MNKRRLWLGRLLLEASCHERSLFCTLTYDDEHLPKEGVSPEDLRNFMKRVRKHGGGGIRFFGIGEYGPVTHRAHYHVALFGLGSYDVVRKSWKLGYSDVKEAADWNLAYMCAHVAKGLARAEDARVEGRNPEFVRRSLKPGLGALAISGLADWFNTEIGSAYLAKQVDVPNRIQAGGKWWLLGRYLTGMLRESVGREKKSPLAMRVYWAEVRRQREGGMIGLKKLRERDDEVAGRIIGRLTKSETV